MNSKHSISPGVSAFVARMRVRTPHAFCVSIPVPDRVLAWRVSPASGRLERRRLIHTHAE
ncbi:hypothetical protein [Pseudomonas sp. LFM046]|uniref:hypothetical protein n=1 Tax=Pseudomonas sp. LFM046 TaxID=1608357 RepID=UPI0005CFAD3C|nr:hypothetical protein [Pseudomonas sp. LFM046]